MSITLDSASAAQLPWLPICTDWSERLTMLKAAPPEEAWVLSRDLAAHRSDVIQAKRLDRLVREALPDGPPPEANAVRVRLAILSSCTVSHLVPALRVAAIRRGLWLDVFEPEYGQYTQALLTPDSDLSRFKPDEVLLSLDAASLIGDISPVCDAEAARGIVGRALDHVRSCWAAARERFGATVIQQAVMPSPLALLGGAEHRLPCSQTRLASALNHEFRRIAADEGVDLLPLDDWTARMGVDAWCDPALWFKARQEIRAEAAPLYGDLVARILAARRGRSAKALVLDLDNTLWGGVVGDDGVEGIALGQGDALGESFLAFQRYVRDLGRRGVILAVCSKNNEANARAPFLADPEMALRLDDIAAFVANWDDKAQNLRRIAATLNIGLDALVFVDDNPFERELVRRELPQVAVPELPDEPALAARRLSDAGYFESLGLTEEDHARTSLYQANAARTLDLAQASDLEGYLRGLDMRLYWSAFEERQLPRVVQLIHKTNQFNLTTRRHDETTVATLRTRADVATFQFRLLDRFGDNGLISVVIGLTEEDALQIDTWLMSCRVLGRKVEAAVLGVIAGEARRRGLSRLIGSYRPTAKNGMVEDLYDQLGFAPIAQGADGEPRWELRLEGWRPPQSPMVVVHGGAQADPLQPSVIHA